MARKALILVAAVALAGHAAAQEALESGRTLFDAARVLLDEGRPAQALELVDASRDPLLRAQGRLYVLHHGGDPAGALEAGLAGLESAPTDPWLAERCATLALDVGATDLARRLVQRCEESVEADPQRESWAARLAELTERAALDAERQRQARTCLVRARGTVVLAGLSTLWALVALGRVVRPPEPG